MRAIRTHVAGVDVHKEILAITVLTGGAEDEPVTEQFTCHTFSEDLMAMGLIFKDRGVTEAAMESTGIFWKLVYNVWSKMGIHCTIGNAQNMKNVPGRKTDMNDSNWIVTLHRCLIKPLRPLPRIETGRRRILSARAYSAIL